MKSLVSLMVLALASACGASKDRKEDAESSPTRQPQSAVNSPSEPGSDATASNGTNASQSSVAAATAEAPAYLVTRVEVDESGQELNDTAETRVLLQDPGQNIGPGYDAGAPMPVQVDVGNPGYDPGGACGCNGDTWYWYWSTPWYPGKLLGRGLWWGRNPYLMFGGQGYNYNYNRSVYVGGYNYYVYARSGY